jgi:hypothetical protein
VTEASLPCVTDLSNVGTGDFHIVFDVVTTATMTSTSTTTAFVNQRAGVCADTTMYWSVRMANGTGQAFAEVSDGTSAGYTGLVTANPVINDGSTHTVRVSRVAGVLSIAVDGTTPTTHACTDSLGTLPALEIAHDVCPNESTAATITNLCITR